MLVVAAARVEADHEINLAEAGAERFQVGRQVVASALLAAFDHAYAARVRNALAAEREDRGDRGENRITIVGAAAAVEQAIDDDRSPGTEAVAPAHHLRLLVQVTV